MATIGDDRFDRATAVCGSGEWRVPRRAICRRLSSGSPHGIPGLCSLHQPPAGELKSLLRARSVPRSHRRPSGRLPIPDRRDDAALDRLARADRSSVSSVPPSSQRPRTTMTLRSASRRRHEGIVQRAIPLGQAFALGVLFANCAPAADERSELHIVPQILATARTGDERRASIALDAVLSCEKDAEALAAPLAVRDLLALIQLCCGPLAHSDRAKQLLRMYVVARSELALECPPAAIPELDRALLAESFEDRFDAAANLLKYHGDAVPIWLAKELRSPNPDRRIGALLALRSRMGSRSFRIARQLLRAPDDASRREGIALASGSEDSRLLPDLLVLLGEVEDPVQQGSIKTTVERITRLNLGAARLDPADLYLREASALLAATHLIRPARRQEYHLVLALRDSDFEYESVSAAELLVHEAMDAINLSAQIGRNARVYEPLLLRIRVCREITMLGAAFVEVTETASAREVEAMQRIEAECKRVGKSTVREAILGALRDGDHVSVELLLRFYARVLFALGRNERAVEDDDVVLAVLESSARRSQLAALNAVESAKWDSPRVLMRVGVLRERRADGEVGDRAEQVWESLVGD